MKMQHVGKTLQKYGQRTAWGNSTVQGNQSLREHPMYDYSAAGGEWEEHNYLSLLLLIFFLSLL
jgi:hypothetical protein